MNKKAIIFSAPSGAGKTTIVHALLKELKTLSFSISATSRASRGEEENGKDYWFLSPEEFKNRIANNEFVEHEEVYPDQFYGTLKSEVESIWENGQVVIFDVDVVGGLNLKKYFGANALSVFVMPPSFEELENRLRGRKTESEEKINMRLSKANEELGYADQFDFILVNNQLEIAIEEAKEKISSFIES